MIVDPNIVCSNHSNKRTTSEASPGGGTENTSRIANRDSYEPRPVPKDVEPTDDLAEFYAKVLAKRAQKQRAPEDPEAKARAEEARAAIRGELQWE